MPVLETQVSAELLSGFEDPAIGPERWSKLLQAGETDAVNLTWHWQRCWWNAFGRGQLLLVAARRSRGLVALAPLFADSGMVFNICPEDHLDFVGDVSDPATLEAILLAAQNCVRDFLGFRFYFVPETSPTGFRLQQAARRLGWIICCEARLACPWAALDGTVETTDRLTAKKSLLRHERLLLREGELKVEHWRNANDVLPYLDEFFEQHIVRRAATPHSSLFCDARQQEYYRQLTAVAASQGWLRFTRLVWNGRAVAHHFGLSYGGRYLWGIPSFDLQLARQSPGEVLLRQVILAAIDEGATRFDFGPGDEAYKSRFATHVTHLETWGLYPSSARGAVE